MFVEICTAVTCTVANSRPRDLKTLKGPIYCQRMKISEVNELRKILLYKFKDRTIHRLQFMVGFYDRGAHS
jgi:hypothetical protein